MSLTLREHIREELRNNPGQGQRELAHKIAAAREICVLTVNETLNTMFYSKKPEITRQGELLLLAP